MSIHSTILHPRQFIGNVAVAPAPGHLALTSPFAVVFHPMFKDPGLDQLHDRRIQTAAFALRVVIIVHSPEFGVELCLDKGHLRSRERALSEFDPPLVTAPAAARE